MRLRLPDYRFVMGALLMLLAVLFVDSVTSYQADHCREANQAGQAEPRGNKPARAIQNEDQERESEITENAKSDPAICGIRGFVTFSIGYMDHHEGFFVGLFTFALVLVTAALWRSTEKLWAAGERQITFLSKSSERQLRAYVAMENGRVLLHNVAIGRYAYTVHMVFRNSGQTPGYDFVTRIEGRVCPFAELPFRDVPPHAGNQKSILGPGDRFEINTDPVPLSANELQAVHNSSSAIFIWGSAEYTDAFEVPRIFKYRIRIDGHHVTFTADMKLGWTLKPHPLGYEAN